MADFAEQLADPTRSYVVDDLGTDVAMVAFGGIAGGLMIPPFEFFGAAEGFAVTKVFVRDTQQVWYAQGAAGLGTDLPTVALGLKELLEQLDVEPAVFGVSAGGFAAIAASLVAGFAECHAFAPQLSLRRWDRMRIGDHRWRSNIRAARRSSRRGWMDSVVDPLRNNGTTDVRIHAATGHRLDLGHVRLLGSPPPARVTIALHESSDHSFVRGLRDSGELSSIVGAALGRAEVRARERH